MLINSDFHDYYDNAAAFGVDNTVVYHRISEDIRFTSTEEGTDSWTQRPNRIELRDGTTYAVEESVLGYCGDLFPRLRVRLFQQKPAPWITVLQTFRIEEYAAWVASLPEQNQKRWNYPLARKKEYRERYFNASHGALKDLFFQYCAPVFLYKRRYYHWNETNDYLRGDLQLNPCLRNLDFQRLKDAPTAFQDIFMFISGVLGMPANPMVEISDAMKKAKHGFDGEYSFKKPPGKKTRWR